MDRILVVEDEPLFLWAVAQQLRKKGYLISSSGTGKAALEILREEPIALAVIDFPPPDMPGFSILKEVHDLYPYLPVIAITTSPLTSEEARNVRGLVTIFLNKPVEIRRLEKLIRKALAMKEDNL